MSDIEGLKEKARRHEQKEEWRKALDVYQRAIARLAEEDAPDIGLHNRVGDLYIRIGEVEPAVRALDQAVELYAESELPNNAIAVCKKILRNVPDRHEVFLRMGQIRARQGFLVDARTHFLTYAERMQVAGELDEALRALVEFADAAPDDTEIRLAIASHFQQHERLDEAVAQLVEGYRSAVRQELGEVVPIFVERLAELRPGEDPEQLAKAEAEKTEGEATEGEATEGEAPDDAPLPEPSESAADAAGPSTWDYGDVQPLDVLSESADEGGVDALERGAEHETAAAWEDAAGEIDEPESEPESEPADSGGSFDPIDDAISEMGPDVSAFGRRPDEENPLEGFRVVDAADDTAHGDDVDHGDPGDDPDEFDDADDATPLPLTRFHDDDGGIDDVLAAGGAALEQALSDVDEPPAEAAELERPEPSAPTDDLAARREAVEEALRSGDEGALVEAYVALGEALRGSGEETRAQGVFREALLIDPDHPEARAAVAETGAAERTVAEVASNEDYVDLGALILGGDEEKTTRFVVAYEEPSGDEQADFTKMLTQFKAKVAENVDASDVKAHHDLGTAYKEMGLLDEAVEEFQAALRASGDHLPTYEMLGQTFLERGTPETAVRVLSRALEVPFEVEDELLGIYYCMGRSHEELGNKGQAREFYERIFSLDINFADVTERLRALR